MKVLIIRFSSFGDIFQAMEAAKHLKIADPSLQVDWLTRSDFAPLLETQPWISNIHVINKNTKGLEALAGLVKKSWQLAHDFDHVFDAHVNLRSLIVRCVIRTHWLWLRLKSPSSPGRSLILRSKERFRRLLFFKLRKRTLPSPYRGAESYVRPLRHWFPNLEFNFLTPSWIASEDSSSDLFMEFKKWRTSSESNEVIALAPSAAWPNKRWPVERWRLFIGEWLTTSPDARFLLLGGAEDRFLYEIETEFGQARIFNAVGKSSLLQSASLLSQASALVANDTGLLHVADRLHLPNVAIIGPTAFGYTVSPVSEIAEVPGFMAAGGLSCKPCSKDGRDRCTNSVFLKCLLDVTPEQVARKLKSAFDRASQSKSMT